MFCVEIEVEVVSSSKLTTGLTISDVATAERGSGRGCFFPPNKVLKSPTNGFFTTLFWVEFEVVAAGFADAIVFPVLECGDEVEVVAAAAALLWAMAASYGGVNQ